MYGLLVRICRAVQVTSCRGEVQVQLLHCCIRLLTLHVVNTTTATAVVY